MKQLVTFFVGALAVELGVEFLNEGRAFASTLAFLVGIRLVARA